MDVFGHTPPEFTVIARIGHQPARLDVITPRINRRQTVFRGQLDDQLAVGKKDANGMYDDRLRLQFYDFRASSSPISRE